MRQRFVGLVLVSAVLCVPVRATPSPSGEIAGRVVGQAPATAPTNGVTTRVEQERVRETFAADAVGGVGTGRTGPVTITITRWSTAEEREQIALELVGDRSDRLAETFARQAETGFVQIPGRPGYRLRYAWEFRQAGRRRILLATDERVRFRQARDGTRVPNFAVFTVLNAVV